ncbi:hypothetical protein MHBO_001939 [Bonamia ostreae]|uniref:Cation efflux protein transmembrane domain-containing protein n=1 Tax=Bonamia ostreae TaxID=126728 RepID=A0ABV2AKQ7_9EUKA
MELQLRPLTEPAELEQLVVQKDKIEEKPRKVKAFYKQQNRKIKLLVQAFRHLKTPLLEKISDNNVFSKSGFTPQKPGKQKQSLSLQTRTAIVLSFFVNILLLLFKGLASFWSGSYSVIASTIDSLLDIVSGSILFAVEMCSARRSSDWYKYPQGKSRLEPLGVIVFSVAMAMVSLQLISTGAQQLAKDLSGKNHLIKFDWVTISIFSATILVKVTLFVYTKCVSKKTKSPAVGALAKDHLNDTMTSFTGFVAVFAGYHKNSIFFR